MNIYSLTLVPLLINNLFDKYIPDMYNKDMIKMKTILKRVDYHLTVEQIDELKSLSNKTGITVASHIRMAVNDYLKKQHGNK